MTARCGRARRLVWPDEHLRVADRELADARAHVAQCLACQQFLADMEAMGHLVRRLTPRPVVPPSVRERLLSAVAHERSMPRRWPLGLGHRARMLVAGATGVAALLMLVLWPVYQDRRDDTWRDAVSAIAADHARELHHESFATSDAGVARQWLSARIALPVHVPDVNGLVLERAEICRLDGRRACLLRYRVDGQVVSYYSYELTPDQRRRELTDSVIFEQHERAGYRVVAWEEAGVLRALVGDLPPDRLLALARACRSHRAREADRPGPVGSGRHELSSSSVS